MKHKRQIKDSRPTLYVCGILAFASDSLFYCISTTPHQTIIAKIIIDDAAVMGYQNLS